MYYPGWDSVKSFTLFFAPMRMKRNMHCGGLPWWQSGGSVVVRPVARGIVGLAPVGGAVGGYGSSMSRHALRLATA